MKFGILGLLLLVAWLSFTFAMLGSSSLWMHDAYAIAGKLLLACLICQAVLTTGRAREFWIVFSVVAIFFVLNKDLLHLATYWTDMLINTTDGGVEYGDYGADKLFPEPEDGQIRGYLWYLAKQANGPILIGLLAACLASSRNVWKWRTLAAIWLSCIVAWTFTQDHPTMRYFRLVTSLILALSCLVPLTQEIKNRRFWLAYAIGCGVWLQASLVDNRFAVRPITVALHEFFELASIPDSPYGNSTRIANVLMFVLAPVVGLLFATVMNYLSKEPRMDADERE